MMADSYPLSPPPLRYLPHLDGLRAVALSLILAYHFQVPGGGGGYVGVDIFLVLSGYLMTRRIRGTLEAGPFSVTSFWLSRFWRLYPAALATTAAAVTGAAIVFPPSLADRTGAAAAAAAGLYANIYYWGEDGDYWDVASTRKPLLHTWSLSLEEQFFVVYPLVLVVLARPRPWAERLRRRRLSAVPFGGMGNGGGWSWRRLPDWRQRPEGTAKVSAGLAAGCPSASARCRPRLLTVVTVGVTSAVSLLLAHLPAVLPHSATGAAAASAAFYLLPARVWEFGAGAAVALLLPSDGLPPGPTAEAVAAAGVVGMTAAVATCRPGNSAVSAAIPAVVGTAAMIATPASVVGRRGLDTRVMRAVGRGSYAAYLVHWPLYVYASYVGRALGAPWVYHPVSMVVMTAISAAALRWTIETPMRRVMPADCMTALRWRRVRMAVGAVATAALVGWCIASDGWAGAKASVAGMTMASGRNAMRAGCVDLPYEHGSKGELSPRYSVGCIVSPAPGVSEVGAPANSSLSRLPPVDVAVVGNSFARHLLGGIAAATPPGRSVLVSFRDACPFSTLRLYTVWASVPLPWCKAFVASVWEVLGRLPRGTPVLVANDWSTTGVLLSATAATEVVAALTAAGLVPVVVGAPPVYAVADFEAIYPCLDFRRFVLWPSVLGRWGGGGRRSNGQHADRGDSICASTYHPRAETLTVHAQLLAATAAAPTAAAPAFTYVNLIDAICTRRTAAGSPPPLPPVPASPDDYACPVGAVDPSSGAYVVYFEGDGLHLTMYGSALAAPSLRGVLGGGARRSPAGGDGSPGSSIAGESAPDDGVSLGSGKDGRRSAA